MRSPKLRTVTLVGLGLVLALLPRPARAQSTIAGLVTDTTGAVLPGVTVEAASPALIEKARTVVTNADGRYAIVDLRPGTYSVTFTLSGFSTVKREGIGVAANVNVPVNVELRVGTVAETVTVTGDAPVVDVQQAAERSVLTRDVLDALPTARTYLNTGAIAPAVKMTAPDLGGTALGQGAYLSIRGKSSNDDSVEIDGIDMRISNGVSQSGYNNFAMVQDVTYQTSAITADSPGGGVRINMIPRDGGNSFAGDFYIGGADSSFQSSNITPELVTRGLPTPDSLRKMLEVTPAFGVPIVKNRLWFFGSGKYFDYIARPAGAHYFSTGAPGYTENELDNLSGRITWQVTTRNKLVAYIDKSFKTQKNTAVFTLGADFTPNVDWGTATSNSDPSNFQLGYVKWTSPASSKLLLEAGGAFNVFNTKYNGGLPGILQAAGTSAWYANAPHRDLVLNTLTGGCCATPLFALQPSYVFSSAVSYVTGSHTFKAGLQYRTGKYVNFGSGANAHLVQQYLNGVPTSVVVQPTPFAAGQFANEWAPYAMDTWTFRRLTISAGLRFDEFDGGIVATDMGAGRFVPARSVPESTPVNRFVDLDPRLGVVYDLFGNAKTALKFSASKYVTQLSALYLIGYNPIGSAGDTRTWFDCDLTPGTNRCSGNPRPTNGDGIAQDNEIGPINNPLFGASAAQFAAPDLAREYSWDYSASLQHELMPGVSVLGTWYFTRTYHAQVSLNTAVNLSSYNPVQVTNPLSGAAMTIYNLNPAFQGQVRTVTSNSSINHRDYMAYEASVQARLSGGGTLLGGWAMERTRTVLCDTVNPNTLFYCDQTGELHQDLGAVKIPYRHEFKVAASYPLPWQFQAGVSLLSYPGLPLGVNWTVPPALFPGGRTQQVTVPLIAPGTSYLTRWNQLDVHFTRSIRVRRYSIAPTLEVFNLANSSVVLGQNQSFGPTLGQPTRTLQGRLVKLSAMVKF